MGYFAIVFEGVWNGQPVAVKRVQLRWDWESDGVEEFQLARLCHPNVIKLLHVSRDEDFR